MPQRAPVPDGPQRVRPATAADVDAVTRVVREAFGRYVERLGREPWPMGLDYAEVVAAGETWVAEVAGGVVEGVLVLEPHDDHLLLDVIAVADRTRGTGVGAALMAHAESVARGRRLPEVRLFTHERMTENLAYYPRHGYVETHRDDVHGFHRVFFTKTLAAGLAG